MIDGTKRGVMQFKDTQSFLKSVLSEDIHSKRVDSLSDATLGVMTGAKLGVTVIGHSLAQARGLLPKSAVKQVDRLLGNREIEAWDIFASWVPATVGSRKEIVVAMDWTDYGADDQATLALKLVTRHGRATPLIWLSVFKDDLANTRNAYEDAGLRRLAELLPAGTRATILADRGFADAKLFGFLDELGFGYVIRIKGNTKLGAADGTTLPAEDWVGKGGRARKLRDAVVTEAQHPVGAAVCVHAKDMKEPWCLVTDNRDASAPQTVALYSKRWSAEPSFRDTKDLRFGMGLSTVRIADPQRRDRLLLLNAFAIVLLTLLGAAGESLGMDRHLKSNTAKKRTHSLFRQGCLLYDLIPNMPEHRLRPLIKQYDEILRQSRVVTETFSII
jgi:hypothetical protein